MSFELTRASIREKILNLFTFKERCLPKKAAAKVHVLQPLARNKMN
jgi:hypothetical protein